MLLTADTWTLPGAAPLHATARDLSRPTDGGRVSLVAQALGTPLLPWQDYTAQVAGERVGAPWCPACQLDGVTSTPTLDGLLTYGHTCPYAYQVVVVTVPRQSGKTTLLRAVGVDRGLAMPHQGVFYSAQTGKDARERWQDLVRAVKASPLRHLATVRSAAGSERVVWPNGSMFRCFAPVAKSLHGYTPPLVMLDESFAHDEQLGNDLMGAIGPAQITLPHRQLWIVSTAGTAESVFLRRWVDAGRAGEPGVAILEWAAGPDVDIYDPAAWPTFHPAMVEVGGRQLVTADALRAESLRLPRSEFERAYGNRWTRTSSNVIAADAWDALANHDQRAPDYLPAADVVFAWDVMHDRAQADLVALWRPEGQPVQARLVKSAPGMAWLADTIAELHAKGYRTFGHANDGPAREVADELAARTLPGIRVVSLAGAEYADAWGQLLEAIARRQLRHDGSDTLAVHASNVATRPMVDRAAPSRRHSAGPSSAVIALMVGLYVLDHRPASSPALDYRFA